MEKYSFLFPSYSIDGNTKLSQQELEVLLKIETIIKKLDVDNVVSLFLFSGSVMRGEIVKQSNDFDFFIFFKYDDLKIVNSLRNLSIDLMKQNIQTSFIFLTEEEYLNYPTHSKIQFFISRYIYGNLELTPISQQEIRQSLISYCVQIKNMIRPLFFFIENDTLLSKNDHLFKNSFVCMKRVDDIILRYYLFLEKGIYPLNRKDLLDLYTNEDILNLLKFIDEKCYNTEYIIGKDIVSILFVCNNIIKQILKKITK